MSFPFQIKVNSGVATNFASTKLVILESRQKLTEFWHSSLVDACFHRELNFWIICPDERYGFDNFQDEDYRRNECLRADNTEMPIDESPNFYRERFVLCQSADGIDSSLFR